MRTELAATGLPVLPDNYDVLAEEASGVSIELDEGGVWVSWQINSPLSEASARAFKVGAWRPDSPDGFDGHPAMHHCAVVRDAMQEALKTILRSLGYGVQVDADEYRPGELLVSARAPGPHWRDPAMPPLAGSAGYSPGVRVRLLSGDFAGSVTTVVSGTYRLSASSGPPLRYAVKHPQGEGELNVAPEDLTLAEGET
ncbi:hypothetical protein AB0J90_18435 [Micromonospora sp. NPDC049523]|uniref:hypothetical protein n=1 Tax=Micromonospora sp. NPDC049523 TaxID=3155921 RepID=UPI003418342C